jgi:hypothetical protein
MIGAETGITTTIGTTITTNTELEYLEQKSKEHLSEMVLL